MSAAFSVIDASVAAKWFLAEADSAQARALLERGDKLVAPALIRIEVMAAILRRFRVGGIGAPAAQRACEDWQDTLRLGLVETTPDARLEDDAIGLSLAIRHGFQDCLYLALAKRLGAPLVTADAAFLARAAPAYAGLRPLA